MGTIIRLARKKVFINERARKQYLNFSKVILFWESIIFVDESNFNIFGSDRQITVWRKPNGELNPKNLSIVKLNTAAYVQSTHGWLVG